MTGLDPEKEMQLLTSDLGVKKYYFTESFLPPTLTRI